MRMGMHTKFSTCRSTRDKIPAYAYSGYSCKVYILASTYSTVVLPYLGTAVHVPSVLGTVRPYLGTAPTYMYRGRSVCIQQY